MKIPLPQKNIVSWNLKGFHISFSFYFITFELSNHCGPLFTIDFHVVPIGKNWGQNQEKHQPSKKEDKISFTKIDEQQMQKPHLALHLHQYTIWHLLDWMLYNVFNFTINNVLDYFTKIHMEVVLDPHNNRVHNPNTNLVVHRRKPLEHLYMYTMSLGVLGL